MVFHHQSCFATYVVQSIPDKVRPSEKGCELTWSSLIPLWTLSRPPPARDLSGCHSSVSPLPFHGILVGGAEFSWGGGWDVTFQESYMYECSFWLYVCAPHACLVPAEARNRASDPLELELQIVLSHHVGAGNWTQVVCKSSICS